MRYVKSKWKTIGFLDEQWTVQIDTVAITKLHFEALLVNDKCRTMKLSTFLNSQTVLSQGECYELINCITL